MTVRAEVLIVEDDSATQALLSAILRRNQLTPVVAENGAAALKLLSSREFDVILLDLLLPEVNGFEVLRHMACLHPELLERVIVITACGEPTYRDCPYLRSVWTLLRKPLEIEEMERELLECYAERLRVAQRNPDGVSAAQGRSGFDIRERRLIH